MRVAIMTTSYTPQAAPATATARLLLWLGVALVSLPPLMGLSTAVSALSLPIDGALTQALTALWFIPEEVFPLGLAGVVLVLIAVRHDERAWRLAWVGTAAVVIGLAGTSILATATGINRSQEALTGPARTAVESGMAAFGLLYVLGLVGLLVLGLRQLRPSTVALARLAIVLVAVALVMAAFQSLAGFLLRRANSRAGVTGGAPVVMSGVGDALIWAALGLVVLAVLAARLRMMRTLVAVAGAVMLGAMIVLKVLGALSFRLLNGPETTGPVSIPAGFTTAMTVCTVLGLLGTIALLIGAIRISARARDGLAPV
ncbi:hypothetical protein [Raineyella fluvialis]|uniref:Uncharacterized protein n=1 Tax=Raineyella fluvialis TaxID=2662261 RepID=A0A5Q2FC74_9ACTN|nr:hypothetical protein [Raineyella fluvialis]QGF22673.1 hypothetical protein Rai3103_02115 [Raineyella fluvialis]